MDHAVVDIGSNSVRLMLFSTPADFQAGVTRTVITRLGAGVKQTGRLSSQSMQDSMEVFETYDALIRQAGVNRVEAYATEAVRVAENGEAFAQAIRERFGWNVRIISGEEEARIGFLGVKSTMDNAVTVIDIGGASTEVIQGEKDLDFRRSFAIGALKFTEDPTLDLREIFTDLPQLQGTLTGIGGTITTVQAMELALTSYERNIIHGSTLSQQTVRKWVHTVEQMSEQDRMHIPGLDPKRAPIIVAGMKILLFLMEAFGSDTLVVSDYGNLEGYALSRILCTKS